MNILEAQRHVPAKAQQQMPTGGVQLYAVAVDGEDIDSNLTFGEMIEQYAALRKQNQEKVLVKKIITGIYCIEIPIMTIYKHEML